MKVGDRVFHVVWKCEGVVTRIDSDLVKVRFDGSSGDSFACDLSNLMIAYAPIDWNAPLEAYHPNGRVVAVELRKGVIQPDEDGDYIIEPMLDGGRKVFRPDGSHWMGAEWRIRNRVTAAAPQTSVHVQGLELTDRMKQMGVTGLVKTGDGTWRASISDVSFEMPAPVVDWLLAPSEPTVSPDLVDRMVRLVRDLAKRADGNSSDAATEVCAIAALLPPEPVDPLVQRAREICYDATSDEIYKHGITNLSDPMMRAVLAALRYQSGRKP